MVQPLFVTIVGSKLYGFNNAQSDTDFKGFGFEAIDEIIGLKTFDQQQYSNNVEDGPNKSEGVVYSIRRYLGLCMSGNPTVIEYAFADKSFWMHSTPIGLEVVEFVKKNMLSKHLFKPYSAYHRAQLRKLQSLERTGKRAAEVLQYGYDLKFTCHAYRLARQCSIVMKEGTLRPTLDPKDKEMCLDIRSGKFTKEEALKLLEEVDVEMYESYKVSSLPDQPDFNLCNDFCQQIYLNYLTGRYSSQFKEFKPF